MSLQKCLASMPLQKCLASMSLQKCLASMSQCASMPLQMPGQIVPIKPAAKACVQSAASPRAQGGRDAYTELLACSCSWRQCSAFWQYQAWCSAPLFKSSLVPFYVGKTPTPRAVPAPLPHLRSTPLCLPSSTTHAKVFTNAHGYTYIDPGTQTLPTTMTPPAPVQQQLRLVLVLCQRRVHYSQRLFQRGAAQQRG